MFWGKPKPQKIPYREPVKSMLRGWKWKLFYGSEGAMPLLTTQTISYDKPASGKLAPAPKLTSEQVKAQKQEEAYQKYLADKAAKEQKEKAKAEAKVKKEAPEGEEVEEKLPTFTLQDIVRGMKAKGWEKSATFAQKWFDGQALIIPPKDKQLGRPIDDTTITLKWALGFKGLKSTYNDLLYDKIYNDLSLRDIKNIVEKQIKSNFMQNPQQYLGFNTSNLLTDLQKIHNTWQFQYESIGKWNATGALFKLTDFTGALANCAIYAAIGIVTVTGSKYYEYYNDTVTKALCQEPVVQLTHVYIYIRDVYEFNGSQYLGHWNKHGVILSGWKFFDSPVVQFWDGTTLPVDVRRGGAKLMEANIYWPVRNSDFNRWRNQHNQGGDFVIFTKPVLVNLKKPIEWKMGKLCGSKEPINAI